ncbi:MAG: hypothetical protein FWF41_08345 [Betaproteobacteria bacterium]|nr:hypothetical protein [Betaproteobacteria bacterium]
MIKQQGAHPELTLADYLAARDVIRNGYKIQEDARNLIFVKFENDLVVVVKSTLTGKGVFITSLRKISELDAKRDREFIRLIEKIRYE